MIRKIIGSALIVTGAGIGAGMLALPLVVGTMGFLYSAIAIFICCKAMSITAFLFLEVVLGFPEKSNLASVTRHTVGKTGYLITWIAYLLMFYSLVASYITGGASLLHHILRYLFSIEIPLSASIAIFTLTFGILVFLGTQTVDYAIRMLIGIKMGAIILLIFLLFPQIQIKNLTALPTIQWQWLASFPIIITSFGYHSVIPTLRDYLDSNKRYLHWMLHIGSLTPLVVYLLWNMVVLGMIPGINPEMNLDEMMIRLSSALHLPWLNIILNLFINGALAISFLCVSLGLFHFICDGFRLHEKQAPGKTMGIFLTLAPPACFAFLYPDSFLETLNYAGIFTVLLFMFLPIWMAWNVKRKRSHFGHHVQFSWPKAIFVLGIGTIVLITQWVK